jgi:hypothetical protein
MTPALMIILYGSIMSTELVTMDQCMMSQKTNTQLIRINCIAMEEKWEIDHE